MKQLAKYATFSFLGLVFTVVGYLVYEPGQRAQLMDMVSEMVGGTAIQAAQEIASCAGPGGEHMDLAMAEQLLAEMYLASLKSNIFQSAFTAMPDDAFESLYGHFGRMSAAEVNEMTEWAAVSAAASPLCTQVLKAGLSQRSSAEQFQFDVSCANGQEFEIDEDTAVATKDSFERFTDPTEEQLAALPAEGEPRRVSPPLVLPSQLQEERLREDLAVLRCEYDVRGQFDTIGTLDGDWMAKWDEETTVVELVRNFSASVAIAVETQSNQDIPPMFHDYSYHCMVDTASNQILELEVNQGHRSEI